MRVIAITAGGADVAARVRAILEAGAEVLVREPTLPAGIPLERLILHARMPGASEVAAALHLSADMDVSPWRRRFRGPLSVSTHSVVEARAALAAGADSAFLSPIFEPRHGRPALFPEMRSQKVSDPFGIVFLGGVTPARVAECARLGAVGVAVMSGIWNAADPAAAARAYVEAAAWSAEGVARQSSAQKLQTSSS